MIPALSAKETTLRKVRILAWILFVAAVIALITFSILSDNRMRQRTESVFALYAQPRALPDIGFTDGKGQAMTLQSFRGQVILLNVWATWCPPCRKEMPTLDRLQQKLGGPDFEVIALSIDQGGTSIVRSFYDDIAIRALRIYVDKAGAAMTDLGIAAIPATLLIDREGREIGRKIGPAEWDSTEIVALIRKQMNPTATDRSEKQ